MNLQVNTMSVFSSQFEREGRHCLEINVSMSRPQIERAIVTLLASMPEHQAYEFLAGEFSEWFNKEESTQ